MDEQEKESRGPSKFTVTELATVGVKKISTSHLECKKCGQQWSPNIQSGGKLPKNYWHCPNGCNTQ